MKQIAPYLAAIGIAVFAVSVDLHNDEPQAATLVLLVGGFILGVFAPARAWRWALMLGLSIFLGDNLAPRLGLGPNDLIEPWNFGTLIALIPATIGSYVGVGVRRMMGSAAAPD